MAQGPILPTEEEAERTQVYLNKVIKTKAKMNVAMLAKGVGKNPVDEPMAAPPAFSRKVPSKPPPKKKVVVIRKVSMATRGGGPLTRRPRKPVGSLGKAKRDMGPANLLEELGF